MLKKPERGWAVVDAISGKLVIFDGRIPIYWRRRVAQLHAQDHGFATTGREPDVRICAVEIKQYSGHKRVKP